MNNHELDFYRDDFERLAEIVARNACTMDDLVRVCELAADVITVCGGTDPLESLLGCLVGHSIPPCEYCAEGGEVKGLKSSVGCYCRVMPDIGMLDVMNTQGERWLVKIERCPNCGRALGRLRPDMMKAREAVGEDSCHALWKQGGEGGDDLVAGR